MSFVTRCAMWCEPAKKNNQPIPQTKEDYLKLIDHWQSADGFTYAYPNHFSQNKLTKLCREKLNAQGQPIMFEKVYHGF